MDPSTLTVRSLVTFDDLESCLSLQRDTWGDSFREQVPPALLVVTQKIGGVLLGAFTPQGVLAGFVYGITGVLDRQPVHWSHMLAVREPWRDHGVGQLLKLRQRDAVRAIGVHRMLWTFDPLVARNAHVNLNRLGVRVVEYVPNLYGAGPMTPLDAVIGTDRLIVEWQLESSTTRGEFAADGQIVADDQGGDFPAAPVIRLPIPSDIQALKLREPERALAWRTFTREAFTHYLRAGYAVRGLARTGPGAPAYILEAGDRA